MLQIPEDKRLALLKMTQEAIKSKNNREKIMCACWVAGALFAFGYRINQLEKNVDEALEIMLNILNGTN